MSASIIVGAILTAITLAAIAAAFIFIACAVLSARISREEDDAPSKDRD